MPKTILQRPGSQQYFPVLPPKVAKGNTNELLQRRGIPKPNKEKVVSSKKVTHPEDEVTASERPHKIADAVSIPGQGTDPKDDSVQAISNTETLKNNDDWYQRNGDQ